MIASHLGPGLQQHADVLLPGQWPVHQVAHGLAHGDGAVAVAELAVVEEFEAAAHGVVPDGEGVDRGVGALDLLTKQLVKAVLVETLPRSGAAEAAQAAPGKGEVPDVHHPAGAGTDAAEALHHALQVLVLRPHIRHDHHFLRIKALRLPGRERRRDRGEGPVGTAGQRFVDPLLHGPQDAGKEGAGLLPALFRQQVLHVRGEAPQVFQPQVAAVQADIFMGRHVIKVLAGRELGGVFPPQVHAAVLQNREEAVELGRGQKGIDRVGKQQQLRLAEHLPGFGKVPLQGLQLRGNVELGPCMAGEQLLDIADGLQGDAVVPRGGAVEDQNVHGGLRW